MVTWIYTTSDAQQLLHYLTELFKLSSKHLSLQLGMMHASHPFYDAFWIQTKLCFLELE